MLQSAFRQSLSIRGRTFKGLRGWAGKPLHPPLTDIPVGAYMLAAAFALISVIWNDQEWARDFYRAASFCLIGGAIVSVFAALTGFWDWLKSTEKGTQARRTANVHAWTMIGVTVLALTDIALRLNVYHTRTYPTVAILVISIVVALLVALGAAFGGTLVFDYGFNFETAGDSPVWHPSETDVLP